MLFLKAALVLMREDQSMVNLSRARDEALG